MATVNPVYNDYLNQMKNNTANQAQNVYNNSVSKVENAYTQGQNKLNLEQQKLNEQHRLDQQKLGDNLYKQAEINKIDATNRGIGNSLQYMAMQGANQQAYNRDLTNLKNTYNTNLTDINNRLSALSQEKATGLTDAYNVYQNALNTSNNNYLNSYLGLLQDADNKEWQEKQTLAERQWQQQQTQADRLWQQQMNEADRAWQKEFALWQKQNLG